MFNYAASVQHFLPIRAIPIISILLLLFLQFNIAFLLVLLCFNMPLYLIRASICISQTLLFSTKTCHCSLYALNAT